MGPNIQRLIRNDPLEGLKTFPAIANELLSNIIAHRIHEKRFPMVGVEDFQEWVLGHKEDA